MNGGSLTIRAPCMSVGHGGLYHSQSPEVSTFNAEAQSSRRRADRFYRDSFSAQQV